MKKMQFKFWRTTLLIALVLFVNGCSKDDVPNEKNTEAAPPETVEVVLPKEAYRLQIVEMRTAEPLTQEEYDGTLGDVPLKLVRSDEETLTFLIPATVTVGQTAVTIPQLNVSEQLEIKMATLQGTESSVLKPFFEQITTEYHGITDPQYVDYLTDVFAEFKKYYETLSAEEKDEMALFYQINKPFFNDLLTSDIADGEIASLYQVNGPLTKNVLTPGIVSARSPDETANLILKFGISVYTFTECGALLALPGTPVEKAILGTASVTGAVLAWRFGKELLQEIAIVKGITQGFLDEIQAYSALQPYAYTGQSDSKLSFVNGESKDVQLYSEQSPLSSAERSSTASSLVSFFDAYDLLVKTTNTVNEVIKFINDHVFFANISEIPIYELAENNAPETAAMTADFFSHLKLSVADDNVSLAEASFENGMIQMKMDIVDPDAVTENVIHTELNYTYIDDFNDVSGSIPIEVRLEREIEFELTGVWQLKIYADGGTRTELLDITEIQFNNDDSMGLTTRAYSTSSGEWADYTNPDLSFGTWYYNYDFENLKIDITHQRWNILYRFTYDPQNPTILIGESIGLSNNGFNLELVKQ